MNLSIIIPVYNVANYVERCIDSCLRQNISKDDYELIIVNDGSTDNSLDVVQKYESLTHVTIVNQSNQGLSVARNNGLKIASGKYVWFVDSDDWIEENCLKSINEKLIELQPDLFQIGFRFAYDDASMNQNSSRGFFEGCITGQDALKTMLIPSPAQFTICRRDFLNEHDLCFMPGIYHEDAQFKPRALYLAKRYCSLNEIVYNYYQRGEGSIMGKFNLKRGKDLITVADSLLTFKASHPMTGLLDKKYNYFITLTINQMLSNLKYLNKSERTILVHELRNKRRIIDCMVHSAALRHQFEGWLFKISIKHAAKLYSIR